MDARSDAVRLVPSMPAQCAAGDRSGRGSGAVAVADPAVGWSHQDAEPVDCAPRLSVDPMRATDRYRLVMPYSARV